MPEHSTADHWALLSDMDGTLLDTEDAWRRAVEAMISVRGISIPRELMLAVEGATLSQAARLIRRVLDLPERVVDLEGELEIRAFTEFEHDIHWRPGAERLMREVAETGIPLALVTSSPRHWVEHFAQHVDLTAFDVIITADDVQHTKPDPEPYLMAAAALGVPTDRCVVLEDSPLGMRAALHAGCRVLLVRTAASPDLPVGVPTAESLLGVDVSALRDRLSVASPTPLPERK